MRAVQLTSVNQLSVNDVASPQPAAGEVTVSLKAAALNHRDVWIKLGQYAGLKWPCIPGSDGAGIVTATGEGVDASWKGREVVINPSFQWGTNEHSQSDDFSILGLQREGTMAEEIAVPIEQLADKPTHMNWEEAAALPLSGLTAYRALMSRARLQPGERVLVSGVGGGVALFAVQFAAAQGVEVWVTSSSTNKIERAVKVGAKGGFDYSQEGWAKQAAKEVGHFDVIVDSAGGAGFDELINTAAPGGRIVFYGATRGDPSSLPMREIFWRQLSLLGTTMGSPADWQAMVDFVATHNIKPVVSDAFDMADAEQAFTLMERGGQFGKIVLRIDA